jgi:hypothetical protein
MPVNMDPSKKRVRPPSPEAEPAPPAAAPPSEAQAKPRPKNPDEPDEVDLAEKEWKHLWEATEVIDMDKW